jgi:hypothetical protein
MASQTSQDILKNIRRNTVAFFLANEREEFKIRGGSVLSSHCRVHTATRESRVFKGNIQRHFFSKPAIS